jgi:hypothetical protein
LIFFVSCYFCLQYDYHESGISVDNLRFADPDREQQKMKVAIWDGVLRAVQALADDAVPGVSDMKTRLESHRYA